MEERDSHSNKNNSNGVNNIKIFTNGSKNDPPKKFVVSRKNYRTINSLMDNITDALKPAFGHVSKIYSATSRKRLTSISDFKQGHNYIVSGKDNLKLVE